MRRIFILEDEIDRAPRNQIKTIFSHPFFNLTIAKSCQEAIEKFEPPYWLMLLDHDMRGFYDESTYHNTGWQFVKWLTTVSMPPMEYCGSVLLHSQNDIGRANMRTQLEEYGISVAENPFSTSYIRVLNTYARSVTF